MNRQNQSLSNSPQSWRELLEMLTEGPGERQRIAEALGVTPYTVTRWVTGESEPRIQNLKRLPEVFPAYQQLFSDLIQAELIPDVPPLPLPPLDHLRPEVPAEFLSRILASYATASGPFRAWSIRTLILQQAIEQLDPDLMGMEITVVQCVPPALGKPVRSLCERMGAGTAPWDRGIGRRLLFLGAESLCGWTVGRGEPGVVQDLEQKQGLLPLKLGIHEKSAVAWPFQREGKLAGCLLVSSTQPDYFTSARLSFIEVYASTLALAFCDDEFHELRKIALHEMPVLSKQQEHTSIARFHDRVVSLRREHEYYLSEAQAEVLVLQQIEAELLDLSSER